MRANDDIFAGQDPLEAEIGHGRAHYAGAFQFVLRFQEARGGEHHAIAVDDLAVFTDEKCAVGVAIECHSQRGFLLRDALAKRFEMQRTAAGIDVAAVRRNAHGN